MWIKICGITRPDDAIAAVKAGADAIGLNFFRGSKRGISLEQAREIAGAVRQVEGISAELVGVFVNATSDELLRTVDSIRLDAVQFHGDESPAAISRIQSERPALHLIRALRISPEVQKERLNELRDLQEAVDLFAVLLDAYSADNYGGTGLAVDRMLVSRFQAPEIPRLILAGGLTPENVSDAISACHPWGVDTASGVESSPGIKCHERISRFIQQARNED
jgi:phosphoribosylanthranilate isomerase